MNFPYFMRRVNRVFTNRLFRRVAGVLPPLAIIEHVGRRSGQTYRTPVVAFSRGRVLVIPMTYGRDADWAQNLMATDGGTVQRLGSSARWRNPRIVDGPEARPYLPPMFGRILLAANLPGYVLMQR